MDNRDEKVEIFLLIFWLSQEGQATSPALLELSTSFSKDSPHSAQAYSKIGILILQDEDIVGFAQAKALLFNDQTQEFRCGNL